VSSTALADQLARAYREARVLVLGDRTPKVDRAFALHREFIAIRASFMEEQEGPISEWEATFLERTRRAIIVALRHQAVAIRDRWSENRSSFGIEPSSPHVDLEHALQLSTEAMELHLNDDADASRTGRVMEFIRQSIAHEKVPAPVASVLPTTTSVAVTASDHNPTPPRLVVTDPGESTRPAKVANMSQGVPSRLPLVTAAGLVLVIGLASVFMRIDKLGSKGLVGSVVAKARTLLPIRSPTPRTQPPAALRNGQGRFEAALQKGIALYNDGWFGPAAGRFREALTIDPRSPRAYLWLGRTLMRSDQHAEARRALEKVIELTPTGPQADEAAMLLSRLP
jgi:tetratricopeptide (TPR) repeat protein